MPATVNCHGVTSGLTLTARLFADGSDTIAATETVTEASNAKGTYTFPNTSDLTGLHKITLLDGSSRARATGFAFLAASGTIEAYGSRLEALAGQSSGLALKSDVPTTANIRTELSTELGRIDAAITSRSTLSASGVRTELATELGRIDAAVSSRSTLSAAGVRTELATELGRIDAAVTSRLASASYTAPDNATILAIQTLVDALPTLSEILAGGDVDGFTLEQSLKLILAGLTGKLSGAAGTTITIRSADDTANRIIATVDSSGNRSSVTLNAAG